ncbi:hypothetical protein, partial [Frankia casuarinae]
MRWFGGFSSAATPPRTPANSAEVWPTIPGCWTVGRWDGHEVRTTHSDHRMVAVI